MKTPSFTRRRRRRISGLLGVLHAGAAAGLALAAPPAVLDRVPLDVDAVVAVESVARLDENVQRLLTAIELNAVSSLSQALGAMGLRDGLDLSASAAAVFFNHLDENEDPTSHIVLLLPVADLGVFLNAVRAEPDDELFRFVYAGRAYFARDLGDRLAAFSPNRDLVASFDATPGRLDARLNALGPRGRRLADRADVLAIADFASLKPLLAGALQPMALGGPGAGLTGALMGEDPRAAFASRLLSSVVEQGGPSLLTAEAGPLGLRLDLAVPFREGTELAAMCQDAPVRPSGLGQLPRLDYLFAGSFSLAHPGMRRLFLDALTPAPDAEHELAAEALRRAVAATESVTTASIAIYDPKSLFLSPLSRTVMAWRTPKPQQALDAARAFVRALDGRGGAPTGALAPADALGEELGGVERWSIAFSDVGSGAMLFGSPGPSGYLAGTDSGGVITWSTDPQLLRSALDAARTPRGGESLASEVMLTQVGALLPEDRVLEWYLNAHPLVTRAAVIGGGARGRVAIPDSIPPIGSSISLSDGTLHAAAFVPAPLLRVVVYVVNQAGAGAVGPGGRGR